MTFAGRIKERLIRALRGELATIMQGYREMGLVGWCATPPQYALWQTHKFTILDAIETASGFCETDYSEHHEWVVVGEKARTILMSLPHLVITLTDNGLFPRERGLTKLGTIGHRSFLLLRDPKLRDSLILFNENHRCARIFIHDAP